MRPQIPDNDPGVGSLPEEENESRRRFRERLDRENLDMRDFAWEENRRRAESKGEDTSVFETSMAFENQVIETLRLREKLGEDVLTGAKNLHFYNQETKRLQEEAEFYRDPSHHPIRRADKMRAILKEPFSVIYFDIDNFRDINNTYGHPAADQILKEVVQRIKARLRKDDVLARCGGDEFRVIALAANGEAPALAEVLRRLIEEKPFIVKDHHGVEQTVHVTITLGVAPYDTDTSNMESRADASLYLAKNSGRNRVGCWDKTSGKAILHEQLGDANGDDTPAAA